MGRRDELTVKVASRRDSRSRKTVNQIEFRTLRGNKQKAPIRYFNFVAHRYCVATCVSGSGCDGGGSAAGLVEPAQLCRAQTGHRLRYL